MRSLKILHNLYLWVRNSHWESGKLTNKRLLVFLILIVVVVIMVYLLVFVLNLYLVAVSSIFWWIFIFHQPCAFWFHGFRFGSRLKLHRQEWLWASRHFWPFQEAYSIRSQVYFYHIKYICTPALYQHVHKLGSCIYWTYGYFDNNAVPYWMTR